LPELSKIETELITDLRALLRKGWGQIHLEIQQGKVIVFDVTKGKGREHLRELQEVTVT